MLSTAQAAKELGVSRITVIRLIHAGQLQACRTTLAPHSRLQIHAESVAAFKKARERQSGTAKSP